MGYNITMSAPSRRQPCAAAAQSWGSLLCIRSQPSIPNFAGSRPNDLSCSLNASSFCSACASAAMIGIQPSPSWAARRTAASDEPPNQMGIGRCTGGGTMLTSFRLWKRPVKLTRFSDQRRRSTPTCSAWRAPRVFHSAPSASYSTWFHPRPMPSLKRPPLRRSTSAACFAMTPV